jgi:D-ribose pyranose/furanose isomerase RbsD
MYEKREIDQSSALRHNPQFKERTKNSRAVIRKGEFTPYANVILISSPRGFDL